MQSYKSLGIFIDNGMSFFVPLRYEKVRRCHSAASHCEYVYILFA